MSDFLANIVEQSMGSMESVQPLIGPFFAPAPSSALESVFLAWNNSPIPAPEPVPDNENGLLDVLSTLPTLVPTNMSYTPVPLLHDLPQKHITKIYEIASTQTEQPSLSQLPISPRQKPATTVSESLEPRKVATPDQGLSNNAPIIEQRQESIAPASIPPDQQGEGERALPASQAVLPQEQGPGVFHVHPQTPPAIISPVIQPAPKQEISPRENDAGIQAIVSRLQRESPGQPPIHTKERTILHSYIPGAIQAAEKTAQHIPAERELHPSLSNNTHVMIQPIPHHVPTKRDQQPPLLNDSNVAIQPTPQHQLSTLNEEALLLPRNMTVDSDLPERAPRMDAPTEKQGAMSGKYVMPEKINPQFQVQPEPSMQAIPDINIEHPLPIKDLTALSRPPAFELKATHALNDVIQQQIVPHRSAKAASIPEQALMQASGTITPSPTQEDLQGLKEERANVREASAKPAKELQDLRQEAEQSSLFASQKAIASQERAWEEPGPLIRVSIGRIEVRATLATAQPKPPDISRSVPILSLSDYLKQRKGGIR